VQELFSFCGKIDAMRKRWLHVSLAILVLVQPATSAAAWAAMMAAQLDIVSNARAEMPGMEMSGMEMSGMEMSGMEMSGCHEAGPDVPDCCDSMNGVACGMDCGTASPAVNQPPLLAGVNGHGAFVPALPPAASASLPTTRYKPPRTS
jgi:hypothetical protein